MKTARAMFQRRLLERRKARSSSPASLLKAKQTNEEKKNNKEDNSDKKCQILRRENANTRRVSFGIFPCVRTTSLKKAVLMAINAVSGMLRNT